MKPDSYNAISDLAGRFGVEAAAEVAEYETANMRAVKDHIDTEKVDCDFVMTRAIDVQFDKQHQRNLMKAHQMLASSGVESTKRTYCGPDQYAEQVPTLIFWISSFTSLT